MDESSKKDYKIYYDILDVIGSGGYGTVFKGKKKNINELRAIKVIDLNKIKESLLFKYELTEIKEQMKLIINGFIAEFEIMKIC